MTPQQKKVLVYGGALLGGALLIALGISLFTGGEEGGVATTTPGFGGSFPGGSSTSVQPIPGDSELEAGEGGGPEEPLIEIVYGEPIAGFAVINRASIASGSTSTPLAPLVRFIDRKTGHVYQMDMTWETREESLTRLTNTTIPAIERVVWSQDGSVAVIQYLDEDSLVRTATLTFPKDDPKDMKIQFVEGAFSDVAVAPDGSALFLLEYAQVAGMDGVRGYIATLPGGARREVFSSSLTQLRATWEGSSIYVFAKPGAPASGGVLFRINPRNGTFVRVYASNVGFAAQGGDGYALADEGGLLSLIADGSNNASSLPLFTFAEKCAFLQTFVYCAVPDILPDREGWHTGEQATNDGIAISDLEGNSLPLYAPSTDGAGHDFRDPRVSRRGDLFVVDSGTSLLWRFAVPRPLR